VLTAGGRVLGVTALGATIAEAKAAAYRAVDVIDFEGAYCRRDIADKAI
jgi:phosphoribosylamine--glycine ligase